MMASGEIRLSGMTMRQMPVLAQSQTGDPYPALNDPNYFSGQSAQRQDSGSIDDFTAIVGYLGASGDNLALSSKIVGGGSGLAADFWKVTGEGISRWSMIGSTVLDGAQAISTFGTMDSFFHAVDATVDVGATRLGIIGTGVGLIWTATGGMKGAASNPGLQPLPPPW